MDIWIVEGQTGEYSDYHSWAVCAYENKADAELHVEQANAYCKEASIHYDGATHIPEWEIRQRIIKDNPFDKNMSIDYTGTSYTLYSLELVKDGYDVD